MNDGEFEGALRGCKLDVLLILTARALSQAGYGDVQFLGRRQRKQKSHDGGHDLLCTGTFGSRSMRVVVKVLADPVRLRSIDEMAGTVRRMQADAGIVVSPHRMSKNAHTALGGYHPMRVEALTDRTFAELLSRYHIGVRSRGEVDYAFLESLESASQKLNSFLKSNRL